MMGRSLLAATLIAGAMSSLTGCRDRTELPAPRPDPRLPWAPKDLGDEPPKVLSPRERLTEREIASNARHRRLLADADALVRRPSYDHAAAAELREKRLAAKRRSRELGHGA